MDIGKSTTGTYPQKKIGLQALFRELNEDYNIPICFLFINIACFIFYITDFFEIINGIMLKNTELRELYYDMARYDYYGTKFSANVITGSLFLEPICAFWFIFSKYNYIKNRYGSFYNITGLGSVLTISFSILLFLLPLFYYNMLFIGGINLDTMTPRIRGGYRWPIFALEAAFIALVISNACIFLLMGLSDLFGKIAPMLDRGGR